MRIYFHSHRRTHCHTMTTRTNVSTRIYYLQARRPTHKHMLTHNQYADVYMSKLYTHNING